MVNHHLSDNERTALHKILDNIPNAAERNKILREEICCWRQQHAK